MIKRKVGDETSKLPLDTAEMKSSSTVVMGLQGLTTYVAPNGCVGSGACGPDHVLAHWRGVEVHRRASKIKSTNL